MLHESEGAGGKPDHEDAAGEVEEGFEGEGTADYGTGGGEVHRDRCR